MATRETFCEVCIVGLGVSSLPLIKELEKTGVDYKVVTSTAFGVWKKLYDAGEDFDLVTTIESTNYSWWDYDYDFPFYTAKGYYEKLLAELSQPILNKVIFADVSRIDEKDSRYYVTTADGDVLVSSSKLVHSIGFSPDRDIFSNLELVNRTCGGKHILISGFSDTTNMYISRLVRAGSRVTITCRHFHVLDKIGTTHGNSGGPFDQYEPMQHWVGTTAAPNITGLLVPLAIHGCKVPSFAWMIGQIQSYVAGLVGLADVINFRRFDTDNQTQALGLVNSSALEVPGGLGYLVKQWPVDEYAKFYNDPRHKDWMLSSRIYLNDIYFFMQQGLVQVYRREEIQHVAGKEYLVAGKPVEFDEVIGCAEATHKLLEVNGCRHYSYAEHLYGMWNRSHPNLFYLGTTRPYTGAFGCIAELSGLFVHRMITDASFSRKVASQFPSLMHAQRVQQYASVSQPDKLHVQWAGMQCLRIAKLLDCDLSYADARKQGLRVEWLTGPITALRCRITGPYAVAGAGEKYRRSCQNIHTNFMALNMFYRTYGDRLVVASYFMTFALSYGFTLPSMTGLEQFFFALILCALLVRTNTWSYLRGFLLMMAFDNLYHKRAWIMLLCNICQFLFCLHCVVVGYDYGIPATVRLGLPIDALFLVFGSVCYPKAFFGDMRARRPYADWLFKTYLRDARVAAS